MKKQPIVIISQPRAAAVHQTNTTTVHEHRAPTDESLKLLTEMEEKVMSRVISSHTLETNVFRAQWYVYEEPMYGKTKAKGLVSMNGQLHELTIELDRRDLYSAEKMIEEVRKGMVDAVAKILTADLFRQQHSNLRDHRSR